MPPTFPRDRYDDLPDELARVGAHRTAPPPGRTWIRLAWAALATGTLVVAGLFGLSRLNPDFEFELPDFGAGGTPIETSSPAPDVVPVTDPASVPAELGLSISVLNATEATGLQDAAADAILAAGWPDPVRANASDRTAETTAIYYRSTEFEGIALGLAELLGTGDVVLSDAFPGAPITIVLGADYAALDG